MNDPVLTVAATLSVKDVIKSPIVLTTGPTSRAVSICTVQSPCSTVDPQQLEHRWLVYHRQFEHDFVSLRNSSGSSRKLISREIVLFYHVVCLIYCMSCVYIRIAASRQY